MPRGVLHSLRGNLRITEKTAESRRFQAGDERIELPLKVLETSVIPFDQSPSYTFKTADTLHPYSTAFLLRFQPLSQLFQLLCRKFNLAVLD